MSERSLLPIVGVCSGGGVYNLQERYEGLSISCVKAGQQTIVEISASALRPLRAYLEEMLRDPLRGNL